jgi:poly(3-hydroxyalkanoate) synthetase
LTRPSAITPRPASSARPGSPGACWLKAAETVPGSWWPDLLAWLGDRCGADKPAPRRLGGGLRPIIDAPGTYVFDS